MKNAPHAQIPVPADTADLEAKAAREKLQADFDSLNPAAKDTAPAKKKKKKDKA